MKSIKPILFFFFLFIVNCVISINAALAGQPHQMLILPFNIHAEKDLSFLNEGILDILSNALFLEGKMVPVKRDKVRQALDNIPQPITEQTALSLGSKLRTDYVVFGSLTVFGDSINTSARLLNISQMKPVLTFNEYGKKHGDIIFHIKTLSNRIRKKILGEKAGSSLPTIAAPKADVPLPQENEAKKNKYSTAAPEAGEHFFSLWESSRLSGRAVGIGVGDLNGDKRNDTVIAGENKVTIFRYLNERFQKIAEIKSSGQGSIIGVDVADINKNRKSEIFITCINKELGRLKSFVLEWDGSEFKKIVENQDWYFRVINLPDRGNVLIGQKRGMSDIFIPGVYELKWSKGRYVQEKRLELPRRMNVYGFTMGDVLNNGQEMIVAFDGNDYIQLLHKNGKKEARSKKRYGGSTTYLEFITEARSPIGGEDETERFYLPQRIHLADPDMDGKNEIVVVNNEADFGRLFEKIRSFKTGYIECLSWDNLGIQSKWKTREVLGYISDYVIADFNNDGKDEIVVSVVKPASFSDGNEESFIVSFKINHPNNSKIE